MALQADGGRVLAEKRVGGYRVVLFGNPSPLRAGLADLGVFLEQEETRRPVIDAVVTFRLNKLSRPSPELAWRGLGCISPGQAVKALQGHSGNGLLYSAMVGIPEPGLWDLGISISRDRLTTGVSFDVEVQKALPPMTGLWPLVAILPMGVFLYVVRGCLLKKRRAI
ncbi:MAG: hypothetical protein WCG66_00390 [bacterium]